MRAILKCLAIMSLSVAGAVQMSNPASAQQKAAAAPIRPATWAVPVALEGAPNLHRVAATFYRAAQPVIAGVPALEKTIGIKTVVSLRAFNSDKKPHSLLNFEQFSTSSRSQSHCTIFTFDWLITCPHFK